MGLLSQGQPMSWDEVKKYAKLVQKKGVMQFVHVYKQSKDRADGPFKWGDELNEPNPTSCASYHKVEYMLVKFDRRNKIARVSLTAQEVFQRLAEQQKSVIGQPKSFWNPEFAAYMVEGTPGLPYGTDGQLLTGLCEMENSMAYRRREVESVLGPEEAVMSITSFPRLGCPGFTSPTFDPKPETSAAGSLFFPDEAIYSGHPRFKTLVKNIRDRRTRKVIINLPIYKDINTKDPFTEEFQDKEAKLAAKPDHVYMDAMGFGMGCCCLQVTLQATHMEEAKVLYDQMTPLTPIALALSAASPVYRGYLTDRDCRWEVISCSVDDRTPEESAHGNAPKESLRHIPKSRYDSVSTYLSRQGQKYNDIPLVYNRKYYEYLVGEKVDCAVARHIAHLFIRDPIALYKEKIDQSDEETDHFENIQSTNWQTMRFKPPPGPSSPIGWRVEFRPLEVQITDFENAAYAVFVILLSRVILAYKLNFLIPLTLVDKNMVEAQKRDAVRESKFWFRRDIMPKSACNKPLGSCLENSSNQTNSTTNRSSNLCRSFCNATNDPRAKDRIDDVKDVKSYAARMTIDEIINGCEEFVGIMPILNHYVKSLEDGSNTEEISKINRYLKYISDRASLGTKTTARLMRDFITSHPKYNHDSVVSDEISYDLLKYFDEMSKSAFY